MNEVVSQSAQGHQDGGRYYEPSGKVGTLAWPTWAGLSLVVFPILAALYAYAIWYVPLVYVNFVITGAFGFSIGYLTNRLVVRWGKVRNGNLALLFGAVGSIIAYYVHWAVWISLAMNMTDSAATTFVGTIPTTNAKVEQIFALLLDPGALFSIIGQVNEVGMWSIKNFEVRGTLLSVIWVAECLIVVGAGTLVAWVGHGAPFSEQNDEWHEEEELVPFQWVDDPTDFKKRLEAGDPLSVESVQRAEDEQGSHCTFTLHVSKGDWTYLSVKNRKASKNSKGELEFDEDEFVEYLAITETMATQIRAAENKTPGASHHTQEDAVGA